jgi:hypothetical protein
MNRKLRLFYLTALASVLFNVQPIHSQNSCGTGAPSQQWEEWFSKEVAKYIQNHPRGKSQTVNYTIPVVVHVIHFGEPYATFPNIDSNQIKSQIAALNQDFSGTGFGVNNVPSAFSGLVANTGIQFCLAAKDLNDVILIERGTERKNAAANNWTSPATASLDLKTYFESVIMPATIWDPVKYLNIWVSDRPANYPLMGFATYPAGSGLQGLFGNNFGTSSNDGIWIWAKAFGTTGTVQAPNDKGRTLTHELGHWFGLRHIWGDGNCLSDYVGDTPWAKQAHFGCVTSTPPNQCGVNQSPYGEMPMNFMDRSDDACMYMFTPDQNVRMQVALSQSPNRYQLGTHGKCVTTPQSTTPSSATASFNLGNTQCLNSPFIPFNMSSGYPYPTYVWSSSPAALFAPSPTQPNPAITISTPGTYTISLVATNSLSSSTYTMLVTASQTCSAPSLCLDSLKMIRNVDTLTTYKVANNNQVAGCAGGFAGYLAGTNCYKDKEFAQFFPPSSYANSVPIPQVNSVIVFFDSLGTKATNQATQITCRIYGGSASSGPGSVIGFPKSDSLGKIVNSAKVSSVGYLGKPNFTAVNTKIIPFRFDFLTPIVVNANSGFYVSIDSPQNGADSVNIFTNTRYNSAIDSSAWYLNVLGNWKTYKNSRNMKVQMAIIPQITCSAATGIRDKGSVLAGNVMVVPNPAAGLFSLVFTLPKEEKEIAIRIYNAIGQQVTEERIQNIGSHVIDIDLSTQPDGIYFTEISNGQQRTVKKVVIAH